MRRNRTASWRSRGSCAGWLRQRQRSFSSRRSPSFDNDSNSDRVSTSLRRKARRNINAVDRDKGLWKPSSTPMVGNEANTSNTLSARGGLEGTFYLQTYGCQMNVNDSEIVRGVLRNAGMRESHDEREADVVLINTCAIRDKAEQRVWQRLREFRNRKVMQGRKKKVVGVLGCMGGEFLPKVLNILSHPLLIDVLRAILNGSIPSCSCRPSPHPSALICSTNCRTTEREVGGKRLLG